MFDCDSLDNRRYIQKKDISLLETNFFPDKDMVSIDIFIFLAIPVIVIIQAKDGIFYQAYSFVFKILNKLLFLLSKLQFVL
jgi:hypothetical protein